MKPMKIREKHEWARQRRMYVEARKNEQASPEGESKRSDAEARKERPSKLN